MTAETVSPDIEERSRKNVSVILNRLASAGQSTIAAGLNVHESTVSKFKDAEVHRLAKMLALLGLKVVSVDMKCFPVDQIEAIFTLAKARMKNMHSIDHLGTED